MKTHAFNLPQTRCFFTDQNFLRNGAIMLLAALLGLFVWAPPVQASEKTITDMDITRAIESALWNDAVVRADGVNVKSARGVVNLTGAVDHLLAKERIAAIAASVVGVRAVVNRIEVRPGVYPGDRTLAKAVEEALLLDPAADSYEVTPKAKDGVVTLTGQVDSWQERKISATVAKGVKGVTEVKNQLSVKPKKQRLDREIQKEIEVRFENDVLVDDRRIKVKVADGEVTLSGTVGSLGEKRRAQNDAYVDGVKSVDDTGLEIKWRVRDQLRRKQAYVARKDDQIKKAVQDAFWYDPRVSSFNPQVTVEDGVVILSGVVENLQAKNAAAQDASNVIGVWRVKNYLKVRPEKIPPDSVLEKRVSQALMYNPWVNRFEIEVDALSGWVYLFGDVTNRFEKKVAERVVASTKGVLRVFNYLTYPDIWTYKPDRATREDIEAELFWSPFVDEDQVDVSVSNGIVTLSGNVVTWTEREVAEESAYEGGARQVINNLTVTYRYYGPNFEPGRDNNRSW